MTSLDPREQTRYNYRSEVDKLTKSGLTSHPVWKAWWDWLDKHHSCGQKLGEDLTPGQTCPGCDSEIESLDYESLPALREAAENRDEGPTTTHRIAVSYLSLKKVLFVDLEVNPGVTFDEAFRRLKAAIHDHWASPHQVEWDTIFTVDWLNAGLRRKHGIRSLFRHPELGPLLLNNEAVWNQ